jgi:hypothetical protein
MSWIGSVKDSRPEPQSGWASRCRPFLAGVGRIESGPNSARLILPPCTSIEYADAQIDDYAGLRRAQYAHRPPLRLSLRARFSHDAMRGTAGFGFWNNPFGAQSKFPALPQAIWFFYASPPSNMALALDVPGPGWKTAMIDASRAQAKLWAFAAPLVTVLCRSQRLYRRVWPRVQRALGINEACITFARGDITDWHTYVLEWGTVNAHWWVDEQLVLEALTSPRGPLGFVAWIDNQYAVVTPQGKLRFGLIDAPFEQWIEIADVALERF